MAHKKATKAILRYQDKDGKNYRIMCDPQKATKIMQYININHANVGSIYITKNNIIFLEKNGEIMLPDKTYKFGVIDELPQSRLFDFFEGQEVIKDYIAKNSPDTYLKFFHDVQEVENEQ